MGVSEIIGKLEATAEMILKVVSEGPQGPKGEKGDTGAMGPPGFKGEKGDRGEDGKTPEKGIDYLTKEDVDEIVNEVCKKFENGNEVKY